MTLLRTLGLLALALLILPACDSTEEFTIEGSYSGISNTDPGFEATLTVVLPEVESGETFPFTATIVQFSETNSVSGTGTYDHPAISLTVPDDGPTADDTIEGTVSDDGETITLVLEDDGSGQGPIVLRRQ